jgi:hypothetical protein
VISGVILGSGTTSAALAAGPPEIVSSWVTEVTATSANLRAQINPNEHITTYHFEYTSDANFQAKGFVGAARAPVGSDAGIGSGSSPVSTVQHVGSLSPATLYHYRVVATNSAGTDTGPALALTTQETNLTFSLPDNRGWEMVSPVDKNGGAIESVGVTASRVFQASADGSSVTYGSVFSFASPQGAPSGSQYLSRRGSTAWSTENVAIPLFSGSYGDSPESVPYQLFSSDLARGLVLNGEHCRGSGGECPVANPPLPGSGAPAGFIDYYLRNTANGSSQALLTETDISGLELSPGSFDVEFVAGSPDLSHVVLSTCAALNDPSGVVIPQECTAGKQNLYKWSGSGLRLVNLLPGQTTGTPGAEIAAQGRAVSAGGSRVFWVDQGNGNLYVRKAGLQTAQVDAAVGGGGVFQTASLDGSIAFFTKAEHLYRYDVAGETTTDLTPSGGVEGVLGASDDGSYLYYLSGDGLQLRHGAITTQVAAAADAGNYPPTTGAARVSPDGTHLAFLSKASLNGYDNAGLSEVYVYGPPVGGGTAVLQCASCNPTGERPAGASTIPGAVANGAIAVYKPRSLSDDGSRVFFDSNDTLAVQDTDERPDVYQWEAPGAGACARPVGCINLLARGRGSEGSSFVDASANGSDVFLLTDESLVPDDPGLVDLYDVRVGGGFPPSPAPIPCDGDSCQSLPPAPEDPSPGTLVPNPGNPPLVIPKAKKKKHHKKKGHRKASKKRAGGKRSTVR